MGYQDIMDDEFEQKDVWVVEDKELDKIFQDHAYTTLIAALRDGPMTVKDITEKYNKIVKKRAIKMDIPKDVFEKMTRSDKTIYRYIKELTDLGVVAISGQRLVHGKTATENLYSRIAKVFLLNHSMDKWWETEESLKVIQRAARLIQVIEGYKEIDVDCFAEQILTIFSKSQNYVYNALNENYEEVSKILTEGGLEETKKLLNILQVVPMVCSEELKENLMKCYKK